jgi:hypothetical protein
MDEPAEEFEHIPWAQLGVEQQAARSRWIYVGAAALVALALGAAVTRALWTPATAEVATETVAAETTLLAAAPATPLDTTPPAAPVLFSEADLMAGLDDHLAAVAAARAEWFVIDYFTADLDPLGSLPVRTAIPTNGVPTLPQDGGAAGVTYVEWARAFRVEPIEPGLYRIGVAFRAVGAAGDEPFFRFPVRAVELVVAVTGDGTGLAVVDLPAPARLPLDTSYAPWPADGEPVPEDIVAAAIEAAAGWGESTAYVSGAATDRGWRVVVSVADDVGNRWPLAVWLDESGRLEAPPWRPGD